MNSGEEEVDLFNFSDDLIKENLTDNNELENVRLHLSQIDHGMRKRPRVHWAQSPLHGSPIKVAIGAGTAIPQQPVELRPVEVDATKLALTGLIRSKSKNSSPMTADYPVKTCKVYESPLHSATKSSRYVYTNAPLSDPVQGTPTRVKSVSPGKGGLPLPIDIEELGEALSSSFFSDTEVITQTQAKKPVALLEDLDDFDFLEPIDLVSTPVKPAFYRRLMIQSLERVHGAPGFRLSGTNMENSSRESVQVSGEWIRCLPQQAPFIVHAIFDGDPAHINDQHGFLVVLPDTLISATLVADSITCSRRAVLSSRYSENSKPNASLVCGSIVHEIVEACLTKKRFDKPFVESLIPEQIRKSLIDIFCCEDASEEEIAGQIKNILELFPTWGHEHLVEPRDTQQLFIERVVQVEENIWSHGFGLKGKLDGTMIVNDRAAGRVFISPFELKTGHGTTSIAHRAQAILYTFMLWDRYGIKADESILFYIGKGELFRLKPQRPDLKSLLLARNSLAIEMTKPGLPPVVSNKHLCSRCFQLESCTLAHKVIDGGSPASAPKQDYFEQRVGHMPSSADLIQFYKKWERLAILEEQEAIGARHKLWNATTEEREKVGICISNLVLVSCVEQDFQFICRFKRIGPTLADLQINQGDPIVVSAADQHLYGLAIGYFEGFSEEGEVSLSIDRPLVDQTLELTHLLDFPVNQVTRFRVDKEEYISGYGLLRNNLLKLAAPENQSLMKLVVKLEAPLYKQVNLKVPEALQVIYRDLDHCQKAAIDRIISTQDYSLVLGMPGSGKSTTLSIAILILISMGKSILLSSHTHSAIDNVLVKIMTIFPDFNFIRVGNPARIDKRLHHRVLSKQVFESLTELNVFFTSGATLLACTALCANQYQLCIVFHLTLLFSPLLLKRKFDVCIMDEASQVSIPASLGPLQYALAFVLIGDHYQLPPLVKSKQAQAEGLNQSLFSLLAEAHPEALSILKLQYRMNEDIMTISNTFVYAGMLVCGNDFVRTAKLKLPNLLGCTLGCQTCWLRTTIDPGNSVMFLNTDECDAREAPIGSSFSNDFEASLVHGLVKTFIKGGVEARNISVISPYRPQIKLITGLLDYPEGVCTSTVDRFQGLDADCIIISLVRSNPDTNIGQLLRDWNRLNVAFTRAKVKLIIVGSSRTVMQSDVFGRLHDLFRERGWTHSLPKDALSHLPQ